MELIPFKCPACGAALKVAEGQVVASCEFCRGDFEIVGETAIALQQARVNAPGPADIWLPFWRLSFQARVRDIKARCPDNIFDHRPKQGLQPPPPRQPPAFQWPEVFYLAAFKATNFVNYGADISLALSRDAAGAETFPVGGPVAPQRPCHYGRQDAAGMLPVLLAMLANKQTDQIVDLALDIRHRGCSLVWWPFRSEGDCYADMLAGHRMLQSALG